MAGTYHFIKDWPPLWCPSCRSFKVERKELPLSINNMWFRPLEQSDIEKIGSKSVQTSHILSPMHFETGSTDYASKTLIWSGVQQSVPIPLGECVEGATSPSQVFENLKNTAKEADFHGPAVVEGTNHPDFLSFQSAKLVQTLHSISAELEAAGVKEIYLWQRETRARTPRGKDKFPSP